jgi:hypothetical protein
MDDRGLHAAARALFEAGLENRPRRRAHRQDGGPSRSTSEPSREELYKQLVEALERTETKRFADLVWDDLFRPAE